MDGMRIVAAGASRSLVEVVLDELDGPARTKVDASFGPVGKHRDLLLHEGPHDLVITSRKVMTELIGEGIVAEDSVRSLGGVRTGVAVRKDAPWEGDLTGEALRRSYLDATAVFVPDPRRATAGARFAAALESLGLSLERSAVQIVDHGVAAMHALAASEGPALGCAQLSEILYTDEVKLVGPLPPPHDSPAEYVCAVLAASSARQDVGWFATRLGELSRSLVGRSLGFEERSSY